MEKGSGFVKRAGIIALGFHAFCQMRADWEREPRFQIFDLFDPAFGLLDVYWTKI
jgi:hypothetical protein